AVDELHHVEARADDVRIVAGGEDTRVGDVGVAERGEHAILAQHRLVAALRDLARGTPQRHARVAAPDLEELVRRATRDEAGFERRPAARESALVHPAGELRVIDQPGGPIVGAHWLPASCSRYSANRARAAATRSGRNSVGQRPGDGLCWESTAFATVTLCTS